MNDKMYHLGKEVATIDLYRDGGAQNTVQLSSGGLVKVGTGLRAKYFKVGQEVKLGNTKLGGEAGARQAEKLFAQGGDGYSTGDDGRVYYRCAGGRARVGGGSATALPSRQCVRARRQEVGLGRSCVACTHLPARKLALCAVSDLGMLCQGQGG